MSTAHTVVVGIDGSQSALDAAVWSVKEAVSRDIPLRLVYAIDPADNGTDHECAARALATAELAIRQAFTALQGLTRWRRRYPELTVQTVAGDGSTLDYLAAHRDSVQLVVIGAEPGRVGELADSDCSLLTCDRQQRL